MSLHDDVTHVAKRFQHSSNISCNVSYQRRPRQQHWRPQCEILEEQTGNSLLVLMAQSPSLLFSSLSCSLSLIWTYKVFADWTDWNPNAERRGHGSLVTDDDGWLWIHHCHVHLISMTKLELHNTETFNINTCNLDGTNNKINAWI